MVIQYIDNKIVISGSEISDFITNIANYTSITITTNINCGTDAELTINTTDIVDNTKTSYVQTGMLYITPQYFSLQDVFVDGIYKITLKMSTATGFVRVHNCYFVDVTIKCKVASLLQNIIEENKAGNEEPISTIAHLLHYSLFNGSNCGCNCEELCQVYNALLDLLKNIDTKLVNDCGC